MATQDSNITSNAPDGSEPPGSSSEDENPETSKLRAILSAFGIGVGAIMLLGLFSGLFMAIYYVSTGEMPGALGLLMENVSLVLGATIIGAGYLTYTGHGKQFIDFELPTLKQVGIGLGGAILLYAVSFAVSNLFALFGVTGSEHAIYKMATSPDRVVSDEFFLLLVPISILIVGPMEEFIYRNIVQKSLYSAFDKRHAILGASFIFAAIHFPAYLTGTPGQAGITLISVFSLALILGTLYAWTENLVVPALAHGVYNAGLFVMLYLDITEFL